MTDSEGIKCKESYICATRNPRHIQNWHKIQKQVADDDKPTSRTPKDLEKYITNLKSLH